MAKTEEIISVPSGVKEYPISHDMPLTGVWNYEPNSSGPVITAKEGALEIYRGPLKAYNQRTRLSLNHKMSEQKGIVISFKIKYDTISPATEVKLALACGLILRFDGRAFNYCSWNERTEWFNHIVRSSIQLGSGKPCKIALCICPDEVQIWENGVRIGVWKTMVSDPIRPVFDWQILRADSELHATMFDIVVAVWLWQFDPLLAFLRHEEI